jgi:GNAT superfamily N-acetyltransferase
VKLREMHSGEETMVCQFVLRVFNRFVAPLYSQTGVQAFARYATGAAMAVRVQDDHTVFVAEEDEHLVGMIEMRNYHHVSLLFVAAGAQRRGIGRRLLQAAIEAGRGLGVESDWITVHASPNAVAAYRSMGFPEVGPQTVEHGIHYVPMTKRIADRPAGTRAHCGS